ncbi:hypothetical protein JOM56_004996 [Amanita muscaria]
MLRDTVGLAEVQLEKDFTQMKLMDSENGRLRKRAFAKEKKKTEKRETTQAHARLMTGTENLDALAEKDFKRHWKEVVKELGLIFKRIRKEISDHYKDIVDSDKAKKAQEKAAKKAVAASEKARKRSAREEAAAAARATRGLRGRGRGGRGRGPRGGARRGGGRGQGRGRGTRAIDSEGDLEGEDLNCLSSSTENECEDEHSESATTGDSDQLGGTYDNAVVDIPTAPAKQGGQVVQPRPCPRPKYRTIRMPAPILDEVDAVADPGDIGGPQSQIGGAPTANETRGEAGTVMESGNGAENGCRYPRRSNRTKPQFKQGIDT